jgi:hypothetical protein
MIALLIAVLVLVGFACFLYAVYWQHEHDEGEIA